MKDTIFDIDAMPMSNRDIKDLVEILDDGLYGESPSARLVDHLKTHIVQYEEVVVPAILSDTVRKKALVPMYLVLSGGSAMMSKLIAMITKGDYSHSSISLTGLNEVVSFGTTNRNFGVVFENIYELIRYRKPAGLKVVAVMVEEKTFEKLVEFVEVMRRTEKKIGYSFKKLLMYPYYTMFKPSKRGDDMICSEFCNWIMTSVVRSVKKSKLNDVIVKDHIPNPNEMGRGFTEEGMVIFEGTVETLDFSVIRTFESKLGVADRKKAIIARVERKLKNEKIFMASEHELFAEADLGGSIYNKIISAVNDTNSTMDIILKYRSELLYSSDMTVSNDVRVELEMLLAKAILERT